MKHIYLLSFFVLFFAGYGSGQTTDYWITRADSLYSCVQKLKINVLTGLNGESAGVIGIDWGDGSTDTVNYTLTLNDYPYFYSPDHFYAAAGAYTVNVSVYSGTAGGYVGTGQSLQIVANGPGACGYIYAAADQLSPYTEYGNVPFDFTGADNVTFTMTNQPSEYMYFLYPGLDPGNAPYTVSINDAWLTANNLIQTTPDITISGFTPVGEAIYDTAIMYVDCNNITGNPDFTISMFGGDLYAVTQAGNIGMTVGNYGCANTADAHVSITFPPDIVPVTTGLTNATFNGTTLEYDILALNATIYQGITINSTVNIPAGTLLAISATVSHPDDTDPSNNTNVSSIYVWNSYDPNFKQVNQPEYIDPDTQEELQYTIHFQNDGNYEALNVKVSDIIDEDLDLSTFELLGSKHGVTTCIDQVSREITFTFHNIHLTPSSEDLEGSQGYLVYKIRENANLPVGTEIENTANIYFDFNPAIVTNTTYNVNQVLIVDEETADLLSLSPNPASSTVRFNGAAVQSAMIFDMTGKLLINCEVSDNELSVGDLSNGIYQVFITTVNGISTKKLVIRK